MKYVLVYEITTKDPIRNRSWPFKVSIICDNGTEVTGAQINDSIQHPEAALDANPAA